MARSLIAVTALFLIFHLSSCSLSSMTYLPEDYHPRQTPYCSGYTYPILDAVLAPMFNIMTLTMSTYSSDEEIRKGFDLRTLRVGTIAFFVFATVASLVSGTCGFLEANRCRRARDSHRSWLEMKSEQETSEEEQEEQGQGTL